MNTFEMLIVFAALMAVISLVAIAIDWIDRPLRTRRFIPRIYRYEDELAALDVPEPMAPLAPAMAAPIAMSAAAPPPAPMPVIAAAPIPPAADLDPIPSPAHAAAAATALPPALPPEVTDDRDGVDQTAGAFGRATQRQSVPTPGRTAHGIARTIPQAPAPEWHPGMALDARIADRKPTVQVKAERYWKEAAARYAAAGPSRAGHFDADAQALMAQGKPPRRRNPRTGSHESAELVGLRAAASWRDVHMRWPGDSIDPWGAA